MHPSHIISKELKLGKPKENLGPKLKIDEMIKRVSEQSAWNKARRGSESHQIHHI